MKFVALVAVLFVTALFASSASAYKEYWGCFERQADGQCVVRVSIGGSFPQVDKQVIREVLADFSQSPNIEAAEAKPSDVTMTQGCMSGRRCGFFTDMRNRKVYIDPFWSYATYCCDQHDGMRGVYCHELMHAIAGIGDSEVRSQPSCFNGSSGYLGVEDFEDIAITYPLP